LPAAQALAFAGERIFALQLHGGAPLPPAQSNEKLRAAEESFLSDSGLPHRPWYKHTIYAPGEYTGYAAVVLPGVTEAIQDSDAPRAQQQIDILTTALNQAAEQLNSLIRAALASATPAPAKP